MFVFFRVRLLTTRYMYFSVLSGMNRGMYILGCVTFSDMEYIYRNHERCVCGRGSRSIDILSRRSSFRGHTDRFSHYLLEYTHSCCVPCWFSRPHESNNGTPAWCGVPSSAVATQRGTRSVFFSCSVPRSFADYPKCEIRTFSRERARARLFAKKLRSETSSPASKRNP